MKSRIEAIVRLLVALVPAVNIILVALNMSPLPFDSDELNIFLSGVVEFLGLIWAWWKNNNITFEAQLAQKKLEQYKRDRDKVGGEGNPMEVQ